MGYTALLHCQDQNLATKKIYTNQIRQITEHVELTDSPNGINVLGCKDLFYKPCSLKGMYLIPESFLEAISRDSFL